MNDGMHSQRLQRLTEQIVAHGLDGLALVPGPNLLYFSGIHAHLSERPMVLIIPADDDPAIIIPTLEAMKAEAAGIAADRIFAWDDTEAVSYTHLDVYKRQLLYNPGSWPASNYASATNNANLMPPGRVTGCTSPMATTPPLSLIHI